MAAYIVCIAADQIWLGTGQLVMTTLTRCGFTKAVRSAADPETPHTKLLFVGHSSYGPRQLTEHLERALRLDTMCDISVLVFQSDRLHTPPARGSMSGLHLVPKS